MQNGATAGGNRETTPPLSSPSAPVLLTFFCHLEARDTPGGMAQVDVRKVSNDQANARVPRFLR